MTKEDVAIVVSIFGMSEEKAKKWLRSLDRGIKADEKRMKNRTPLIKIRERIKMRERIKERQ